VSDTSFGPGVRGRRERVLRLRFLATLLVVFWTAVVVAATFDKPYFAGFIFEMASSTFFTLLFVCWWWFNRGLSFGQKFFGFIIVVAGAVLVRKFLDRSVSGFVLWSWGAPVVATVIALWFKRARRLRAPYVGAAFTLAIFATWAAFLLIRSEGTDSSLKTAYRWRWTPSAEEKYLAGAPSPNVPRAVPERLDGELGTNQWPAFRGANRDGVVLGSSIATNWSSPPAMLWKRAVGPAWSSVTVIGRRLFTQEQRGASEAVVCYDADTGAELWGHEDVTRFEEPLAGIGPRATPTFDAGKLYTLGGTGILNCLDAATGRVIWSRDIQKDSDAPTPMWGFSSSPLVANGKVIVYAGGPKGLLAYGAADGELIWTAPEGESSYASAQMNVIDGVEQCVMLDDSCVKGLELASGKELWRAGAGFKGAPRSNQPRLVSANEFLVGAINGAGLTKIKVERAGTNWTATTEWISKDLKPEYPDFVVFQDHAYGFDVNLFCCINIADGKRTWKDGRYGRGQVVLLADQALLLVASESGDLVLLAADPAAHRELGKFKALEGKTWNGPVVNGDRIYHRNAQEMACLSFSEKTKVAAK
jgi:outer membrane protein assembly factor BamB